MSKFGKNVMPGDFTPHPDYEFFIPAKQVAADGTTAFDRSGTGADATGNASLSAANMWATVGSMSSTATNYQGPLVADPGFKWDLNKSGGGESLILAMFVKVASGATTGLCGKFGSNSGIRMYRNTGNIYFQFGDGSTTQTTNADAVAGADNTFHHIAFCIDAVLRKIYTYIDAVAASSGLDVSAGITGSTYFSGANAGQFMFGGDGVAATHVASSFHSVHALTHVGGLPADLQSVINLLYSRGNYPLRAEDCLFT